MISTVNTVGGFPDIAQNDWIEIKGANLAPASFAPNGMVWSSAPEFASGRMPTQLANVSVTVNGKSAFVYYISPSQINVLTPLDNALGPVQIVVRNGSASSAPFNTNLRALVPAFLRFGASRYVVATHADGSLLGPASMSIPGYQFTPARQAEMIVLYGAGFGLPGTTLMDGSAAQTGTLNVKPDIQIGGLPAEVQFAGVVSPGLYQFNVLVPASASSGDIEVTAVYAGSSTPSGAAIVIR